MPTASSGSAPYNVDGRGQQNTTKTTWAVGDNVVKLEQPFDYPSAIPSIVTKTTREISDSYRTTKLGRDIPATQALRAADATFKCRTPNTSDTRYEIPLDNADLIAPILDYQTMFRIGSEFFVVDSADGAVDAVSGTKRPKQVRNPNTSGGTVTMLFNGGKTTIYDDVEIHGGALRLFGSDGINLAAVISNDDGHVGDGSILDSKTGVSGLTVFGPGTFTSDLKVKFENCVSTGVCASADKIWMKAETGSIDMGETLYMTGKIKVTQDESDKIFHVDNLGSAGTGGTTGPKDFAIYQSGAIDSFGIEKYWTSNGGRRYTYVAADATAGIGQLQTSPLQVNQNYLLNVTSTSNMVVYLPTDAQTGDMIRFVELSGNLTYNTSLVIRALKIGNVATAIQGDATGTKINSGSGNPLPAAWDSGELIIQSRNASFGLVYVGNYDILGSTESQTIPASLRGWWLMEL